MASPLQSFIMGEQAARQAARFPSEQASRDVGIERQRQTMQQQGQAFDQQGSLKGAQLMNQVVQRVKQVGDPNQRLQIFERVRPELQKFGVEFPQNLTVDNVTDEGLIPLETGLGRTIQQLTGQQREFRDLTSDLSPDDVTSAKRIKLGLDPRAVGSGNITIAQDDQLTDKVAESQREIKSEVKRGEKEAESASEVIEESFNRIGLIQGNIRNVNRAISALDRGAKTGAVQQFLPNITAASRELNQIQSELGLDVVGATTFGALSKGELDLALNTALPVGLDEPALKDFLIKKRDAQTKLMGYLDDQIEFLEDGGTLGGWRALVRRSGRSNPQQQEQESGITETESSRGGEIMVDDNGNRAVVFPDGTFREL